MSALNTWNQIKNNRYAILGPCAIESLEHSNMLATKIKIAADNSGFYPIFKGSFQKANRSSIKSFSGLGIGAGLEILNEIKKQHNVPVTTDVHETIQVEKAAQVVDILQIPAFLSRQTDLLRACAQTGLIVNVKKAQFMSGDETKNVVDKLVSFGNEKIILTERGTSFGYNNLIVDFRNIIAMKSTGASVCMDATHSVQLPGAMGEKSGGQRKFVALLARAAAISGVDGFFMETHEDPDNAPSDGPNMVPINSLDKLLVQLKEIMNLANELEILSFENK